MIETQNSIYSPDKKSRRERYKQNAWTRDFMHSCFHGDVERLAIFLNEAMNKHDWSFDQKLSLIGNLFKLEFLADTPYHEDGRDIFFHLENDFKEKNVLFVAQITTKHVFNWHSWSPEARSSLIGCLGHLIRSPSSAHFQAGSWWPLCLLPRPYSPRDLKRRLGAAAPAGGRPRSGAPSDETGAGPGSARSGAVRRQRLQCVHSDTAL